MAIDRNIKIKKPIAEDPLISGKDIEHLQHKPSFVMKVIFQRDLENTRKGKWQESEIGVWETSPCTKNHPLSYPTRLDG